MPENILSYKQFWGKVFPEFKESGYFDDYLVRVFGKKITEIEDQANKEKTDLKKYRKKIEAFVGEDEKQQMRFFYFYEPIIAEYIDELNNKIESNRNLFGDKKSIVRGYIFRVSDKLCNIVMRTMVEEINEAKTKKLLKGNDSNERYEFYIHELLKKEEFRESIYKKYPELVRLLDSICCLSSEYIMSVIDDTVLVSEQLKKVFGKGGELGKVIDIRFSLGDSHCNGKSVVCVTFEKAKVFYKPRKCEVDLGFQELLNRLNKQQELKNNKIKLKTIKIVQAGHGAFVENIEYRECKSEQQIHGYFKKIGVLCCLMYFINARDLHFENIIACGPDPVMIDLESILSAETKKKDCEEDGAFHKALEYLLDSVQSLGILPNKIRFGNSEQSFNSGGIIYKENQVAPLKSMKLVDDGSDQIRLIREHGVIKGRENLPRYKGKVVDSTDYLDDLSWGFSLMYRFVLDNREVFIDWVKELFWNARVRIILRPTFFYGQLQSLSHHPCFMYSAIEREMVLARIGIYEPDAKLIRSEIGAMKKGDIPYYSVRFNETDLHDGYGTKLLAKMESSPWDHFRKKMNSVSAQEMEKQLELIRISFYSVTSNRFTTKIKFASGKKQEVPEEEYLATAKQIGDYLIDTAFTGVNNNGHIDAFWIHSTTAKLDSNDWSYGVSDLDFYNGNSGIALFLQNLWKVTGEQKYLDLSRAAIEPIVRVIEDGLHNYMQFVGGFFGIGSYIYILYKAFSIVKEERVRNALIKCMGVIDDSVDNTKESDLIGGTTGLLTVLLNIYEKIEDTELKKLAESKFQTVFSHIEKMLGMNDRTSRYSGFAHGVAGILPALYRLYLINGSKKVYGLFQKLLEHERIQFWDEKAEVWKTSDEKVGFSRAWCHGAPGILLALLLLKRAGYEDDRLNHEIQCCIENTKKECIGYNIVYCHGDIGNLDILNFAARVLNDHELEKKCKKTYDVLFGKYIQHGWNKDDMEYSKCKGIMLGISGIGYSVLRTIRREETDDFLWLE